MPELVKAPLEDIQTRVEEILPRFPEVAGAYLYGPVLRNFWSDSKINLELVVSPYKAGPTGEPDCGDLLDRVGAALGEVDGHPFAAAILRPDEIIYSFKVIQEGKLVYTRDRAAVWGFVEYVTRRHPDIAYRYYEATWEVFGQVLTGIDTEKIKGVLDSIEQQVADLRQLAASVDAERFVNDPWLVRGVKYALQTAIEAMIDVSYYIAAQVFTHAPIDADDAIDTLAENGVIAPEAASVYKAMIGFRNRVAQGHDQTENKRIYDIMQQQLGDFGNFVEAIKRFMKISR